MQKLIQLVFFFTITSYSITQAQPTLISSDIDQRGGNFIIQTLNNSGLNASSQGSAGANQVWDFSTLSSIGNPTGISIPEPDTTFFYSDYFSHTPVNTCENFQAQQNFNYLDIENDKEDLYGSAVSGSYVAYEDPERLFNFPFSYNSSFKDTFNGYGITLLGGATSTGTISVTADGYGTLKTPAGTFPNALRIKTVELTHYDYQHQMYQNTDVISYKWYINDYSIYLFSIAFDSTRTNFNGDSGSVKSYSASYTKAGVVTATNSFTPFLSLNTFPNPSTGKIYLRANEPIYRVNVSNVLGQNVIDMQPEKGAGHSPVEISLADLPAGIYFCNITTAGGNATRQIVKE